jgi:protocatechuate 3,4-dioxygenase beta subunit
MKTFFAVALSLLVLVLQQAAFADGNTANVRGYVRDLSGKPVAGAIVTIASQADSVL